MKRFQKAIFPLIRTNIVILLGGLALALWQRDFVISAVTANVYLNVTIFAGTLFGVLLHLYNLHALKAEFIALEALREAFEDASRVSTPGANQKAEAARRRDRLKSPMSVFGPVKLLAQPMSLLMAQVYRFGDTRIPSSSAAALVADLNQRVAEKISLSNYIAGLMVLLGLLGTFIGLLGTVGSVGDIIASLDISGGVGGEAIKTLMTKLEAPLTGMATGFSSSLFGLIGSLLLGVMTKISARGDKTLKRDFESWLNRVAQFERLNDEPRIELDAAAEENDQGAAGAVRAMLRIARASVVSNAQVTRRLDQLIDGYKTLERESERARESENALAERLERSIGVQIDLLKIVRSSYESTGDPIARMSSAIERMEERLIREHGRARELQAQQNRAIVLQADQAAQRSAMATTQLGQQTRALRETIETLGRSLSEVVGEVRNTRDQTLSVSARGPAAPAYAAPESRSTPSPAAGAAPTSFASPPAPSPESEWDASDWALDDEDDLGEGWGQDKRDPLDSISSKMSRLTSERRTLDRRGAEDRRRIDAPVAEERRSADRRSESRRDAEPKTLNDDINQAPSSAREAAPTAEAQEVEVDKWMIEFSATDFDDDDEDSGGKGRRSIA